MSVRHGAWLPARYDEEWGTEFWEFVDPVLVPGATVLDIGAGRRPTILPERRPEGVRYVGLDISPSELESSDPGSYDEIVVADAEAVVPELAGRFDLIVAWQVLEHFRDLPAAAAAIHTYAKEGGWFVSVLSGRRAAFSVANRILPSALGSRLVALLMRREVETVFPAHYDHCDESGLHEAFSDWEEVHVFPLWRGASYFTRLPGLRRMYVVYENWAMEHGHRNLATHYAIAARKGGAPG